MDDFIVMQVDEGLQGLFTDHPDLRLCERSLQFCDKDKSFFFFYIIILSYILVDVQDKITFVILTSYKT